MVVQCSEVDWKHSQPEFKLLSSETYHRTSRGYICTVQLLGEKFSADFLLMLVKSYKFWYSLVPNEAF